MKENGKNHFNQQATAEESHQNVRIEQGVSEQDSSLQGGQQDGKGDSPVLHRHYACEGDGGGPL